MSKKQLEAYNLLTDNETNELLYGGGARGGKSVLGCIWIITQCFEKPGSYWLIGRETMLSLKQSTMLEFWTILTKAGIRPDQYTYRQDEQMVKFTNGSIIFFKGIPYEPSDPEYNYIGSITLTGCFIDEAQEIRQKAIEVIRARCSHLEGKDDQGNSIWKTIPKALYTCNPDKGWVYHDFYKPFKEGILGHNRAFIPALVIDNPFIGTDSKKSYIENLKKGNKVTVQRLLFGNFDYDETHGKIFDYDALKAMWTNPDGNGKKYITCDASRGGGDRTVIMLWEGYTVRQVFSWDDKKLDFTMEKLKEMSQDYKIPMNHIIIDENGLGGGAVDSLRCRGFVGHRKPISPLAKKYRPELQRNYHDLRCQCLMVMAKLVNDRRICILDSSIEKDLVDELDLICYTNIDKDEPIKLTQKEIMKTKLPDGRSPDVSDCWYLRGFFELYLTDQELSEIDRIYNPHIDEDIYGNTMALSQSIENFIKKQSIRPNAYKGSTTTDIF